MNADQVQTIINEAAKNLPGHLALILTTECDVELDDCGELQIDIPWDVCRQDSDAIVQAIKTAAEHYQPPLHPWQIN
jgi:hypothetical protein